MVERSPGVLRHPSLPPAPLFHGQNRRPRPPSCFSVIRSRREKEENENRNFLLGLDAKSMTQGRFEENAGFLVQICFSFFWFIFSVVLINWLKILKCVGNHGKS
jgi:hypothetical protein